MAIMDLNIGLAILRLRKLGACFATPVTRHALRLGVSPAIEHRHFFRTHDSDFVVDIGANRGQFLLEAARHLPQATFMCYEPLSSPFRVLERVAVDSGARVSCFQLALSDAVGTATMYVTEDDDSSSLLKPGSGQLALSRRSRILRTEAVVLDEIRNRPELQTMGKRSLLKIDSQGSELMVLRGADSVLNRFVGVYVECSFVRLYEHQDLAHDIIEYLRVRNFGLEGVYSPTVRDGAVIQADLFFANLGSVNGGHHP